MKYTKYTIQTTNEDADMVSVLLMDAGIFDIQIENNIQLTDEELNQIYADFKKDLPEDDGTCKISFFVEEKTDPSEIEADARMIEEVKAALLEVPETYGIAPVSLSVEKLDSADWENNWKEYFKPFRVDQIQIVPTWEEIPEDAGDIVIRIDPGMAFGTGTHETTRLCLRGLLANLSENDKVLDLGCGSGILGICALKLGADAVTSVDIDEQAVRVAKENYEVNGIDPETQHFFIGNAVSDEDLKQQILSQGPFEVVVVNILADVIAEMMPSLDQYLVPGGKLITSGILDSKEQLIKDSIAANPALEYEETEADGDWVRITARKRA
ncbi:MAG: 50S ribosomal protein L11 methyltransferase [Lachnospiraceae bacterium]|nr:50S ribosomal protein L11 methyltransferase [Lachnospiraceae bacterium]